MVGELLIVSAGMSAELTRECEAAQATIIDSERGRGKQLRAGGVAATQPWLLFLHADSVLRAGCGSKIGVFMMDPVNEYRAACFSLKYATDKAQAKRVARWANWRTRTFGLPFGDQGLLVQKALYDQIGGYADLALMEDITY